MKLKSWIKSADIYAKNIQFTYRNKNSFSTQLGGLISFIVIIIIIIYGCILLSTMYSKEFPFILKTTFFLQNPLSFYLFTDSNNTNDQSFYFPIAIGFQYEDQVNNISGLESIDPTIFDIKFQQKFSNKSNDIITQNMDISLCKEKNFENLSDQFKNLNMNLTYCINNNFSLYGNFGSEFSYLEISLRKCLNKTFTSVKCKPLYEIDEHLNSLKINLYYISSSFNSTSSNNYIIKYLRSMFWDILPNYQKTSHINIEQTKLISYENFIPVFINPYYKTFNTVDFDKTLDSISDINLNEQVVWNLEIKSGPYSYETKRFYIDFLSQISNLGGLSYVLISIGTIFAFISTEFWVDENLINEFYNMISPENTYKVKLSFDDFLKNVYNYRVRKFINEIIMEENLDKRPSVDSDRYQNPLIINKYSYKDENVNKFKDDDPKLKVNIDEKDNQQISKHINVDTKDYNYVKVILQPEKNIIEENEFKNEIRLKDSVLRIDSLKDEIRFKEAKLNPLETLQSLNYKEDLNDKKFCQPLKQMKEPSIIHTNNIPIPLQFCHIKEIPKSNLVTDTNNKDLLAEHFDINIIECIYGMDKTIHREKIIELIESSPEVLKLKEKNTYDFRPLLNEILLNRINPKVGEHKISQIIKDNQLGYSEINLKNLILENQGQRNEVMYLRYKIFYNLLKYELNDKMYFTPSEIIKRIFCFCQIKKKYGDYKSLGKIKTSFVEIVKQNLFKFYEKPVNLYRKYETFDIGREMLYRDLDLIRVLNTVKEFDRFKKIFFDDVQINIFNTFLKKKIYFDGEKEKNILDKKNKFKTYTIEDTINNRSNFIRGNKSKSRFISVTKIDFEENNEKNDKKYISNFDHILQGLTEQKELSTIEKKLLFNLGIEHDDIVKLNHLLKIDKEEYELIIKNQEKSKNDQNVLNRIYPNIIKYFVDKNN